MPKRVLRWKRNVVLPLVWGWLDSFLSRAGDYLWEEVQGVAVEKIAVAQEKFEEGKQKRDWAVRELVAFVEDYVDLNFATRYILRMLLGLVVDGLVKMLKEEMGDDWGDTIREWLNEDEEKEFNLAVNFDF